MTMREIRKEYKIRINACKILVPELVDYLEDTLRTFEDLWKYGTVEYFSKDFLKFANGYQINTGNYESLHILQTLDLHKISASKATTKDMMVEFLK